MSANPRLAPPHEAALFFSDLAHRMAREMRIASALADDCQDAFGDDDRTEISPQMAMRLQGLDLLSQQLIELGKLLDRMAADSVQGEYSSALLDDVVLSDLKRRLSGQADGIRVVDPELW